MRWRTDEATYHKHQNEKYTDQEVEKLCANTTVCAPLPNGNQQKSSSTNSKPEGTRTQSQVVITPTPMPDKKSEPNQYEITPVPVLNVLNQPEANNNLVEPGC